jgi:hypothetical protein
MRAEQGLALTSGERTVCTESGRFTEILVTLPAADFQTGARLYVLDEYADLHDAAKGRFGSGSTRPRSAARIAELSGFRLSLSTARSGLLLPATSGQALLGFGLVHYDL